MPRSTEELIPGVLPPKERTDGVDFLSILDAFDPSTITEKALIAFAKRDPFITGCQSAESIDYYEFNGETHERPLWAMERRLSSAEYGVKYDREELQKTLRKLDKPNGYKNARQQLTKAIGAKAQYYYLKREASKWTDEDYQKEAEERAIYEQYLKEDLEESDFYDEFDTILSDKVSLIRKRTKVGSRYLPQRDFAKFIDYPVSKYVAAEQKDEDVTYELLEKLIMICHANPYFIFDDSCGDFMADSPGVECGDAPAVIVGLDVIWKWIKEGRPRDTDWSDGVML